ncbi:MAG: biotin--[acetyl-CoA-carboxylase] ligase [Clostridia bacterium]|nr:biotin--[acetyl-CoA-carboxylase] ligase [Clostridia bacterium]
MKLKNLKTKFLGKNNFYYENIDSTQKEIWRRIDKNIENGTLIVADTQTAGIGTHGRKWYTDKSNNIAFSLYYETNCNIRKIEGITVEIAQVLNSILKKIYNIDLQIKEPNDLYFNNKKIGGILTENKLQGENSRFLVIGIGINTSQTVFNEELNNIATSIKKEFNIDVDVEKVITEFCNCFEEKIMKRIGN